MNKIELREKWSKYTDTDALVDQMQELYEANGHDSTINGICAIVDMYFTQNWPMIEKFMQSKHYLGDMRIAVEKDFDRQISASEISRFFGNIHDKLSADNLYQFTDKDGKCFQDYLYTGKNAFIIGNLPGAEEQTARKNKLNQFSRGNMATIESDKRHDEFIDYMYEFRYHPFSKLQRDIKMNNTKDAPLLRKGTKTSRAFNTVCQHYGVDKFNPTVVKSTDENGIVTERTTYPYNKVFAEYSDLVSDLTRKMWFVISLNPLDYLTMSNGVNWHSCHNLGATGCYKGGTLSYMLDQTSIITYVISDLSGLIHKIPKLYRQMFHYSNDLFMQNRLYPQGNDGATDLYEKFRNLVIEEFNGLLNIDGEWEVEVGYRTCKSHARSTGAHYKDYHSNDSCSVFYPVARGDKARNHVIAIGHNGICAKCGKIYTSTSSLTHGIHDADCIIE